MGIDVILYKLADEADKLNSFTLMEGKLGW
jgi:hypothetical protein